jgi:hypothetical protein
MQHTGFTAFLYLLILFIAFSQVTAAQKNSSISVGATRTLSFDNNWLFLKDSVTNAEQD